MPTIQKIAIYDELVEVLAECSNPQQILSFRLSSERQARLAMLLEKNRSGNLTESESAELGEYEHVEHLFRLFKARIRQKLAS